MSIQTVIIEPGTTELRILLEAPSEFADIGLVPDIAWTWHAVSNLIVHEGEHYLSGVQRDGTQVVHRLSDQTRIRFQKAYTPNDHNTPGMFSRDGRIECVAMGHNTNGDMHLRHINGGESSYIGKYTAFKGTATYAQLVEREGRLFLFSRCDSNLAWHAYEVGPSGLAHAGQVSRARTQSYAAARRGGILGWTHPNIAAANQGWIYRYDWSPGAPAADFATMSPVYVPPDGRSSRVLDVTPDGASALIVEFDKVTLDPLTAEYVILEGLDATPTQTRTGVVAGHDLTGATYFLGGCFDGDDVWLCHAAQDGYALSVWRDGGLKQVLSDPDPLARPVAAGDVVAVMRVRSYASFRSWGASDARLVRRRAGA